ncbi:MAG TPA: hypothetical protein VLQ45_15515 [Thermoanaerobaculia bacterium]|nr:hypothetical protein [Thermoanaerobaculia bacterium]
MPRERKAVTVGELLQLAQSITPETRAGKPHLEHQHARLRELLEEIEKLTLERDAYAAKKQEATRKINVALEDSRRRATILRGMLKAEIGPREEALAAFKIQPYRGRKSPRKSKSDASPASSAEGDSSS